MKTVSRDRIRPFLVAATLCVVGAAIAYADPNPPLSEQPVHGGDITGALTACGTPTTGVTVYIPGRSFLAITDQAGGFKLNYVPPGTYPLVVRNRDNQDIATIPNVVVIKNRLTALGGVALPCDDADGDGFDRLADCNDGDASVFPGAAEVCNAVDDNCDAVIDEGCQACVDGDGDGFSAQAAGCGIADCDDADAAVNPNAAEVCQDGIDNNCDAQIDEACPECQADADCETNFFCNASNACEAKRVNGEGCTEDAQCLSRSCVLEVCTQPAS